MKELDEILKQIECIENQPMDFTIDFQSAQKAIDALGGKVILKEGDSVDRACYYITLLAVKKVLKG